MNVSQLLSNIRNQALIGNSGLAEDTTKLVAYLNIAYRKLYDIAARNAPYVMSTTQLVSVTSGSGTLSPAPYVIINVRNVANNTFLEKTNVEALEASDAALTASGAPSYWYLEGLSTIKSYPSNTGTLSVRYIPNAEDLNASSVEAEIKLPPMFHDLLMYETLKTLSYDERDKINGAEVSMIDRMYEEAMGRFMTYMQTISGQPEIRTEAAM